MLDIIPGLPLALIFVAVTAGVWAVMSLLDRWDRWRSR